MLSKNDHRMFTSRSNILSFHATCIRPGWKNIKRYRETSTSLNTTYVSVKYSGQVETDVLGGVRRVVSQPFAKITIDSEPCMTMLLEKLRKSDWSWKIAVSVCNIYYSLLCTRVSNQNPAIVFFYTASRQ